MDRETVQDFDFCDFLRRKNEWLEEAVGQRAMSAPLSYGYDKSRDGEIEALTIVRMGEVRTVLCSLTGPDAQAVHRLVNMLEAELAALRTRAETAEAQLSEALDNVDALESELSHSRQRNGELMAERDAMRAVGERLYFAGRWTCEDLSPAHEVELWTQVRDVFGIKPGAATREGVANKGEG